MASRTRVFLVLSTALLLTGCLGNYTGRPERRGPRSIKARGRTDSAVQGIWRQVVIGSPPKEVLEGYLHTEQRVGLDGAHWVYDPTFTLIGRISPAGRTTRITVLHGEKDLGSYNIHHAMLRLFRHTKATEVKLVRMPPPRG